MPPTSRGSGDQVQLQQQLICLAGNPIVSSLVGWMPNHFSRNHLYWISFQTLCFSVAASIRFLCFNTISRSMPLFSTTSSSAFLYPISISLIHSNRIRNDQKDLVFLYLFSSSYGVTTTLFCFTAQQLSLATGSLTEWASELKLRALILIYSLI